MSFKDRWSDESAWGDYTKDIVIMPRRRQIVAVRGPGANDDQDNYRRVTNSHRLLHPVRSPVSWTKLRTIYGQNENNKKDLQQWLHPKWSMWWWNYVDTELCILFLTFSIVLALRGPVWVGDCCFFVIRHFRRTHILSLLSSHRTGVSPRYRARAVTQNYRPGYFITFSRMF